MFKIKKIICIVFVFLFMFLFVNLPVNALVNEVVYETTDFSKVVTGPALNQEWEFVNIESNVFNNAILFDARVWNDRLIYGVLEDFDLQKDKNYRFVLPLAFSVRTSDTSWKPETVILGFANLDNSIGAVFRVFNSNYVDTYVGNGLYKRVFLFDFTVTSNTIIDCPNIIFSVIDNEEYTSNCYMGIEKNKSFTITEVLSDNQMNEEIIAGDEGNKNVDELENVIPNQSQGFIDGLGNLVSAMSYDGTACNWTFPAIKLPAISGVMGEVVLSEETEIPFEFWIGKIPEGIMTLVRALCTIALVVYCFKELYSVISYVLTLRGGGASE